MSARFTAGFTLGARVDFDECFDTLACDEDYADAAVYGSAPESPIAAHEKSSSVYLSIISQQTFIGCWKLNTELSSLLSVSLDQLQNSAPVKVSFMYSIL